MKQSVLPVGDRETISVLKVVGLWRRVPHLSAYIVHSGGGMLFLPAMRAGSPRDRRGSAWLKVKRAEQSSRSILWIFRGYEYAKQAPAQP